MTPKRLSTNFANPAESPPSKLFTCPFLIMCNASKLTRHTIFNHVT